MCRTAFIVLALAALTATSANGSPYIPATTHRSVPATAAPHSLHKKAHRATAQQRATPQEVGRAAGLKIRRDLARRKVAAPVTHAVRETRGAGRQAIPSHATPRFHPIIEASERNDTSEQFGHSEHADSSERADSPAQDGDLPAAATPRPVSLRKGRIAMPPPLKGSRESLERQNEKSEAEGLERIQDEDDLADRIAQKLLVPVPASAALAVNGNLPQNHRYCRPWTARFLSDLAQMHDARFHRPLEVSSAVRTVEYQKRLMEINGNAAPAEGDIVSPHLTGATIDIAKTGMSQQETGWMRSRLLPLEEAGKIDVEEEFQQACFHITVYKNYVPPMPPRRAGQARSGKGRTRPHRAHPPAAAVEIASRGR
ncbi:MAG: DUF5715 family protein [Terracidiphilus sp.]|jgi:hypothetical protein